ncbi:MAG: prepilin-type N-terminal cleavage/methylation domain-containing protein [Magnetococcales bacterium]|nr:prepilin-type N-terminal cleavage/methylation domain-containing protein [Magnetococcales bacterium]
MNTQTACRRHIHQAGFTLIELIMVIVILGILAAVAVPKFTDLSTEAEKAAADGVYSAAQSATTTNFAANRAGKGLPLITTGLTLLGAMDGNPEGWTANAATLTHTGGGVTYTITITAGESTTAKAQLSKSW